MKPPVRRLMFVTDAPGFGGAERYIIDMARAAIRRGITPVILWTLLPGSDPDTFAAAAESGISVTTLEPLRTSTHSRFVRAVAAALAQHAPDALIVNACGRPRFWTIPWLARSRGIPAIWVHHMVEGRDHRRLPPHRLGGRIEGPGFWRVPQALRHRLAAAASHAVVVSNEQDRQCLIRWQRVSPASIRVIPPGIDTQRFRFQPEARERVRAEWRRLLDWPPHREPFVVGTAARLVDGKGVDLFVEAIARARGQRHDLLAVIAGNGPQRAALETLARARRVDDCVVFVDFQPDMPGFYSGLDVFALCSVSESFGLVLAEAMACRRAVVATPTAGARLQIGDRAPGCDILQPLEAPQMNDAPVGCLLKNADPGELAALLCELAADPDRREELGRRACEAVRKRFSIDRTFAQTLQALHAAAPTKNTCPQLEASPV